MNLWTFLLLLSFGLTHVHGFLPLATTGSRGSVHRLKVNMAGAQIVPRGTPITFDFKVLCPQGDEW